VQLPAISHYFRLIPPLYSYNSCHFNNIDEKCTRVSLFSGKIVTEPQGRGDFVSQKIFSTFILNDLCLEAFNFDILWLFPPESNDEVFKYSSFNRLVSWPGMMTKAEIKSMKAQAGRVALRTRSSHLGDPPALPGWQ